VVRAGLKTPANHFQDHLEPLDCKCVNQMNGWSQGQLAVLQIPYPTFIVYFKKKKKLFLIIYSPPCHPRCPHLSSVEKKLGVSFDLAKLWWKHFNFALQS